MLGDAERDVTAGIAAGMRTIVARYGYIEAHEAPKPGADGDIDHLRRCSAGCPRL
jgi:phosphoglycolate phosphatase